MDYINENITFNIREVIWESDNTKIYRCQIAGENDNSLYYVIKELINPNLSQEEIEREKVITHDIENRAGRSIVIPVLWIINQEENKYALMQFKRNGLFLGNYIEQMEKKYGNGNIPMHSVLDVIEAVLISLQELHHLDKEGGKGYLHLDLHPGNIFMENAQICDLSEAGTAKFIDFFDAVEIGKEKDYVSRGYTLGYSAPERKYQNHVQTATDIYSVAAIMYRMVTGTIYDEMYIPVISEHIHDANVVVEFMLKNFFERGLMYNPKYRIDNTEDALKWIRNIRECQAAYEQKDLFALLSMAYDLKVSKDKLFLDMVDEKAIKSAVDALEQSLLQQLINTEKCYYIFRGIWNCVHDKLNMISPVLRAKLLSNGIACCNHTVDGKLALMLLKELDLCKAEIPVDEYLKRIPKIAEIYADQCNFKKAQEQIAVGIKVTKQLKETYFKMASELGIIEYTQNMKGLAVLYSAMGRYRAFVYQGDPKEQEEIIQLFEAALEEFKPIDGNDIWRNDSGITMSHLLHFLLVCGEEKKTLFEKYAAEYFTIGDFGNAESLSKCLDELFQKDWLDLYRLVVYLKAIYVLYLDVIDDELVQKIRYLSGHKKILQRSFHPIELVYKYIALILLKKDATHVTEIKRNFNKAMTVEKRGRIHPDRELNILMCMSYQTQWTVNQILGEEKNNEVLLEQFLEHSHRSGWEQVADQVRNVQSLENLIGYEYA